MDWFTTQRDHLWPLFRGFFGPDVAEAILALARPALRLSYAPFSQGSVAPMERSRLGGEPMLPPQTPWPVWGERRLDFLALVDFAELATVTQLPGLPESGVIGFYYAVEIPRPWGDDPAQADGWRVLPDARTSAGPATVAEYRLSVSRFVSLPSVHEPALLPIAARVSQFAEIYAQLYGSWSRFTWRGGPRHQAGGWPVVVQRALWQDCALAANGQSLDGSPPDPADTMAAEREWRLLLQLDSDDRLGWCWGETGLVYFSARAADVRSGSLDRTWLILQATP